MLAVREATGEPACRDGLGLLRQYLDCNGPEVRRRYGMDWNIEAAFEHDRRALTTERSCDALVAYADDVPAGIVLIAAPAGGLAELARLYVAPRHRQMGIGLALLERAVALARRKGCPVVRLYSADYLRAAHALYRRFGFRETARPADSDIPQRYQQHFVFMELALEQAGRDATGDG